MLLVGNEQPKPVLQGGRRVAADETLDESSIRRIFRYLHYLAASSIAAKIA
jgi:hypothetical protein